MEFCQNVFLFLEPKYFARLISFAIFFQGKVIESSEETQRECVHVSVHMHGKGLASDVQALVQLPGLHGIEQCRMENYSLTFELGGVKIQSVLSYCWEMALTNGLLA